MHGARPCQRPRKTRSCPANPKKYATMGDAEARPHATTTRGESHRGERNARIDTLRVKRSRSLAHILLASPRRGGRVQRSQSPFSPRNLHGKPCDGGGESHLAGGAEVLRERNHELLRGDILHGAGSVRHGCWRSVRGTRRCKEGELTASMALLSLFGF